MGEEKEELAFELLERIEDAYRLPTQMQVALFLGVEFILIIIFYYVPLSLSAKVVGFLLATSLIYPYAIKVRNFPTELLAVILFGCTIAAFVYYLAESAYVGWEALNTPEFWILVIFVLVFSVELFHHMYEKARTVRSRSIIIVDLILTIVFAFASWMFLSKILSSMWAIMSTLILTLLYFYAIFPEKPF